MTEPKAESVPKREALDRSGIPDCEPIMQCSRVERGIIYFPFEPCASCRVKTNELYCRTTYGKNYCTRCMNRGAGVGEYENEGTIHLAGEELKARARANGYL